MNRVADCLSSGHPAALPVSGSGTRSGRDACRAALAIGLFLALTVGCKPNLHTAPDAAAWPLLEKDPAEDGRHPDRWPAWRGLNGQGIAPGGRPAIRFGPSNAVRWKVAVPPGNSSPVVWDSQIFLTAPLDDAQPPTLGVLAFDRRDGREIWRAPAGKAKGPTHDKNGYSSASVATDGGRVVAFFGSTGLFCFDSAGRRLWQADLGTLDQKWGTACSPVLHNDRVFQLCDSESQAYLAAFELAGGRRLWRTPRASKACWSTPALLEVPAKQGSRFELIVNGSSPADESDGWLSAYDPSDGRALWQVRGTTHLPTPTPLLAGGLVFSLTGRNGPLMAVRPGEGLQEHQRIVWRTRRGGPYIPSGVVYRNRLYVVSDAGVLTCYNPGNGTTVWQTRLSGPFTASLVAAAGRIYATNERGTCFVLAAGDHAQVLAENPLGERTLATPAIVGDDIVLRTERHLYCFGGGEK